MQKEGFLTDLWTKIVDHKDIVIKVAGTVIGAALGAGIASVIVNVQEESVTQLTSEDLLDMSGDFVDTTGA